MDKDTTAPDELWELTPGRIATADALVGKTIAAATLRGVPRYDDLPYLDLTFTDGSKATVTALYWGYTGCSEDEYPQRIRIDWDGAEPEPEDDEGGE